MFIGFILDQTDRAAAGRAALLILWNFKIDLIRFQPITIIFQTVCNLFEIRIRYEQYVRRDDPAYRKYLLKEDNIVLLMRQ